MSSLPFIKDEVFIGLQGSFANRDDFGKDILLELRACQPALLKFIRSAIDKYNADEPTWVNGLIFGVCTSYAAFSRQAQCDELEGEPMAKKGKKIELTCCTECPHHCQEQDFTSDSFDLCYKWECKILDEYVRRHVEWTDHSKFIPKNCPLENA